MSPPVFSSPGAKRIATLQRTLGLVPHPEGGSFVEHYREHGTPSACTAIYFLLCEGQHSAWHRVEKDELWHHHEGASVSLHLLDDTQGYRVVRLGAVSDSGGSERPSVFVPAGTWQAAVPHYEQASYVLVGNTVAPGFSFSDWQLADGAAIEALSARHPDARDALMRYARAPR